MKPVAAALTNALKEDYTLSAQPRLLALWNMNRFSNPTTDNIPSEDSDGYDAELFPIESIIEPLRPRKGIAKARIGEAAVTDYSLSTRTRYYIGDVDDVYKYWTSPVPTNISGVFPNHTDGESKVRPFVLYPGGVNINKIVMQSENYWATAENFKVLVKTTGGGAWTEVNGQTEGPLGVDGRLELWFDGVSWTRTAPISFVNPSTQTIHGIMFKVTTMTSGKDSNGQLTTYRRPTSSGYVTTNTTGNDSFFNLIELAGYRQVDLTDRLISVEDTFDMSEASALYPIGTLTSNDGSITLSNLNTGVSGETETGYFNRDNEDGLYYGLLEPNVEFRLSYVYDVDGTNHEVQQFIMYGDIWQGLVTNEVTIALKDYSKFFDETYPRPAMHENLTVPQIFQRLLDSIGFTNYVIDYRDSVEEHIIPVFWVDGRDNIWEVLNSLAIGTQTAIYFDGFGRLQIKTRDGAFDFGMTTKWTFNGENNGSTLSDIVDLTQEEASSVNYITITYKTTKWDTLGRNGVPAMQKVWEPEGTVTLRASVLSRNITTSSSWIYIPTSDIRYWPFSGIVQVGGELMKYIGKQFIYYEGPIKHTVVVKSLDEWRKYNSRTAAALRHKNNFTGGLRIDEDTRGLWNSEEGNHNVDASSWSTRHVRYFSDGTASGDNTAKGFQHLRTQSRVRLSNRPKATTADVTLSTRGAEVSTGYNIMGTKFRFVKNSGLIHQFGGMVICSNNTAGREDGYYIEVRPTSKLGGKERATRNEVIVYTRKDNKKYIVGPQKGVAIAIAENIEYEMDVMFTQPGGDDQITVWINGKNILQATVSTHKNTWNGRFGMFVRGKTRMDFEYIYGTSRDEVQPDDDSTFFNLKYGGYTGGFWDREYVYRWKTVTRRRKKKTTRFKKQFNNYLFDEFGPYVHEVREFDVQFDPAPVQHSRLYMSNTWSVICTQYRANPFGANFILANASRENAVVSGEDALRFGNEGAGNRVLTAIGRVLVVSDADTVVAKNDDAIRMRGKVEAEISSDWIQTKAMATDISIWVNRHWGDGVDELTVEVFGNPLLEITDVVAIRYPEKFMVATTHKYYITGINTSFEAGIKTTLTLRRIV